MQVATIRSVAKQAGVSTATVSRFLNSQNIVRPATQKKISAAIMQLRYEPNLFARQLSLGRKKVTKAISRRARPADPTDRVDASGGKSDG